MRTSKKSRKQFRNDWGFKAPLITLLCMVVVGVALTATHKPEPKPEPPKPRVSGTWKCVLASTQYQDHEDRAAIMDAVCYRAKRMYNHEFYLKCGGEYWGGRFRVEIAKIENNWARVHMEISCGDPGMGFLHKGKNGWVFVTSGTWWGDNSVWCADGYFIPCYIRPDGWCDE